MAVATSIDWFYWQQVKQESCKIKIRYFIFI
jgi:hypothetical protein